jgi:hypothetical protein
VARRSVTAISAGRLNRGDRVQIEIDHLLERLRGGTVAQAFGQGLEPRRALSLDANISANASFQRFDRLRRAGAGERLMVSGG